MSGRAVEVLLREAGELLNLFPSVWTSSGSVAERGGWSGRTMAAGGTTGWGRGGVSNAPSSLRVLEPVVAACTLTGWMGRGGGGVLESLCPDFVQTIYSELLSLVWWCISCTGVSCFF